MSPEQVKAEYEKKFDDPTRAKDIDLLYGMLIPLGQFHTNPLLRIKGESWAQKAWLIARKGEENDLKLQMELRVDRVLWSSNDTSRGRHWYACRHIQLNGDCSIYDKRPEMCRTYPNGTECMFSDCTWSAEGQKKHNTMLVGVAAAVMLDVDRPSALSDSVIPVAGLTKKVKGRGGRKP